MSAKGGSAFGGKKNLFVLALGLIVLAACAGQPVAEKKGEKISGSIEDLLAKNKNLKCELLAKDGGEILAGTTYISGTKARSDFKTKMEGKTVNGHMISDGTWVYSWMDELPQQAMKIKVDTMQSPDMKGNEQAQASGVGNYEDKMDYDCYNWSKDDSLLTPPSDVNFIDYSKMLEAVQGLDKVNPGVQADKTVMCAACANITDATAKAGCLKQLGCQ
ncbi:MAG: hypothetical protein NTX82_05265 [Candidatus Parcubacteria bacterium]|nr:hypothetical protein [Candidatus Parcubacteria bacterium]